MTKRQVIFTLQGNTGLDRPLHIDPASPTWKDWVKSVDRMFPKVRMDNERLVSVDISKRTVQLSFEEVDTEEMLFHYPKEIW